MSDDEIKNALTRYRISEAGGESTGCYGIEVADEDGGFVRLEDIQRLFSQEDVRALRGLVETFARDGDWFSADDIDRFASLAARIQALLPPETK